MKKEVHLVLVISKGFERKVYVPQTNMGTNFGWKELYYHDLPKTFSGQFFTIVYILIGSNIWNDDNRPADKISFPILICRASFFSCFPMSTRFLVVFCRSLALYTTKNISESFNLLKYQG